MKYKTPIEHQILALQEIAHRSGWNQGKRENLQWAIETLRFNDYPDAADLLERLTFGETVLRVKQATGLKPNQHQAGNQTTEVKTPDTAVRWPDNKTQ